MEIEAKFAVPTREAYRQLLRQSSLAGYALAPAGATAQVTDLYLDTEGGDILAAGYACRLRSEGGVVNATLKGLGDAGGAVHRREELEVVLPELTIEVSAWPDSPARALALELTGGGPLQPLFELTQRRVRRDVMDAERRVAQFSLDDVRAAVGRRPAFYYELEIELAPDGTEADLARLAEVAQAEWGLVPEPHSKFQRALAVLQMRGAPISASLSGEERMALEAFAHGPDVELARRAAVVLAWVEGLPTREIVARTGLSSGRIRFWLREFRARRMGIFSEPPEHTLEPDAIVQKNVPALDEATPAEAPPAGRDHPTRRRGLPTVRQFADVAGVDLPHARYVSALALAIFDALRPLHRLPRKRRRLLRQAALLYTAGATLDASRPHRAGRDLILSQPMRGVSTDDRLALAALVALNRARVRPEREVSMAALDAETREQVLAMTAILQVAESLDFSRTQGTLIERLDSEEGGRLYITLSGPAAEVDALQGASRSGLWYDLFGQELVFAVEGGETASDAFGDAPSVPEEPIEGEGMAPASVREAPPSISSDEPMSEAGRKILYLHFGRMLANEEGVRLGEDIEAVHDMRVATRRMRAAFQIFAPYYKAKAIAPHLKGLRRTGQVLGAVRDLDVLLDKARRFQQTLSPEEQATLTPLINHWEVARDVARRELIEYLDSAAYRDFVEAFETFLTTPGAGADTPPSGQPVPYLVRHVTPQLLFERYEAVRAYDALLPDAPLTTYHLLRIDGKRLRYALEFFKDVLGAEAGQLIKQVTAMQDHLGELQDAHVAELLLVEFLGQQQKRKKKKDPPTDLTGVEAYLKAQRDRQAELVATFGPSWAEVTGYELRRNLGLAVASV